MDTLLTAARENALTESERRQAEEILLRLLRERGERYLMGDSSSMPAERAVMLLRSILFCLGLSETSAPVAWRELLASDAEERLLAGIAAVRRRCARVRMLYAVVCIAMPKLNNRAMRDTLGGIGTFFRRYDPEFFAAELPCDIDYPLMLPVPETLTGVDYIERYLRRIAVENAVLSRAPFEDAAAVLARSCPDWQGQVVNVCLPVLNAALGRAALELPLHTLAFGQRECALLSQRVAGADAAAVQTLFLRAAARFSDGAGLAGRQERAYLSACAAELAARTFALRETSALYGVFAAVSV